MLRTLDLFSGIGGFSLGLERTGGFKTIAFCEIEKFPRQILRKHWPDVPVFRDVKNITVDASANPIYINKNGNVLIIDKYGGGKMTRDPKYDCSVDLYNRGMSIQDCADFFGITRQAMHMILKRRGCKFRDNKRFNKETHFYRGGRTPGQKRACHLVEKAVKKGVITPTTTCEHCGAVKPFRGGRCGIQAHHNDYNKPLEVVWLCQKCHHEWHKINTPKEIREEPANQTVDVVCGGFP